MLRIATALLAAGLLAPATANAKKPVRISLYHVTAVQATGELSRTYQQGSDTVHASGIAKVENTRMRRKGWRGVGNTAFWGTDGWGRLRAPFGTEQWSVQGTTTTSESSNDDGTPKIEQGTCSGTRTRKDAVALGDFDRRKGRFVLVLRLPEPPDLACDVEGSFLQGRRGTDPVVVRIDPRKMRGKKVTIPFEHRLHRRFEHDERDGRGVLSTEEMTLTWKGSMTLERGYGCTVPPDYPCHTMLL